jgi:hypothetical protein
MTPLIRAPEGLQPSRTTRCSAHTTPAADFCDAVGVNRFTLSHDSVTHHRPPEVSSTAFDAQPPDLPPAVLMEMGFAAFCPLAPCRRPHHPILVHRLASLLHASFTPRLATTPLRFAITSPPSGCEEDFHLQAVKHARHTKRAMARLRHDPLKSSLFYTWGRGIATLRTSDLRRRTRGPILLGRLDGRGRPSPHEQPHTSNPTRATPHEQPRMDSRGRLSPHVRDDNLLSEFLMARRSESALLA